MHAPNTNITRFLNFNSNDPLRPRNMKSTKWQTSQGGGERQHLSTVEDVNGCPQPSRLANMYIMGQLQFEDARDYNFTANRVIC